VLLPSGVEKDRAEFFTGAPAGLDRVAVRAEGNHLGRVVRAPEGQIVHVVDLQDRAAPVGAVLDVAGAARVSATAPAAKKDSATRIPRADEIGSGSFGPNCVPAPPEDVGPYAEAVIGRGQRRERCFGGTGGGRREQPEFGKQFRRVGVEEIPVHEDAHRRGPRLGRVSYQVVHGLGEAATWLVFVEPVLRDRATMRRRYRLRDRIEFPQARAVQRGDRVVNAVAFPGSTVAAEQVADLLSGLRPGVSRGSSSNARSNAHSKVMGW
jgi:hypothetical protein